MSGAVAFAAEPIKIGILDPLSSPYKTSSIHDVHGANVAVDLFNKKGGVLGRPVVILEADDASNPDQRRESRDEVHQRRSCRCLDGYVQWRLRAGGVGAGQKENKLFMVTGAHLTRNSPAPPAILIRSSSCRMRTMLSQAVVPHLVKAYGTRWHMITAGTVMEKRQPRRIVDTGAKSKVEFSWRDARDLVRFDRFCTSADGGQRQEARPRSFSMCMDGIWSMR